MIRIGKMSKERCFHEQRCIDGSLRDRRVVGMYSNCKLCRGKGWRSSRSVMVYEEKVAENKGETNKAVDDGDGDGDDDSDGVVIRPRQRRRRRRRW